MTNQPPTKKIAEPMSTKKVTKPLPIKTILKKAKQGTAKRRYNVALDSGRDFFARTFTPKKKTGMGLRRVTFSGEFTKKYGTSIQQSGSNSTWFKDTDYTKFSQDNTRSLAIIKNEFETVGNARALDPSEHCVEGLERYLSTGIERTLYRFATEHSRDVLAEQEQERRRRGVQQAFAGLMTTKTNTFKKP